MSMTIEGLAQAATKISELDGIVSQLDSKALDIEVDTVEQLLVLARVGMRPRPIVSKERDHNCNTCNHPTTYEYHDESGILLLSEDGDNRYRDGTSHGEHDVELWLTSDGLLLGDWSGHVSHWQDHWNNKERSIQPVTTEQAVETFGLSEIVDAVKDTLSERLKRMGQRSESAQRRLNAAERVRAAMEG